MLFDFHNWIFAQNITTMSSLDRTSTSKFKESKTQASCLVPREKEKSLQYSLNGFGIMIKKLQAHVTIRCS